MSRLVSAGIESSGDVVTAVLTLLAIHLGGRPADAHHPYGHRRAENLSALGEAACCESLAGQKDEAIAHLRRTIELSERSRSFLEGDPDLDPIREDPAFKELLAG